jgi:hypothetical protein
MKPLILTGCLIREFIKSGFADLAVDFFFRFVTGPLPPLDELATIYLGARIFDCGHGSHWSDDASRWGRSKNKSRRDLGLAEFCLQYEAVELWFDTNPNTQLLLVWLLDHFRSHPKTIAKLKLRLVDQGMTELDRLDKWRPPAVDVTEVELATASAAWQAYQATTPEACFDLLSQDLRALPLIRPALTDLLKELPSSSTGLGATEMRMLELISEGNACPPDVFPGHEKRNKRRVFGYWEIGALLDGLARCPMPVVSGLDEGPFTLEMHEDRDRHARYKQSRLSLTELGQAVLAGRDDFSRHNPISRWWGGTQLTNDRLWRWDPVNQALIAP